MKSHHALWFLALMSAATLALAQDVPKSTDRPKTPPSPPLRGLQRPPQREVVKPPPPLRTGGVTPGQSVAPPATTGVATQRGTVRPQKPSDVAQQARQAVRAHLPFDPRYFTRSKVRKMVDWSYWRMNHPQFITAVVRATQEGKLPKSSLDGIAPRKVIDAMLKTKWVAWMPATLAARDWKPVVSTGVAPAPQPTRTRQAPSARMARGPIAQYTDDQMKSATWTSILKNTQAVAKPAFDLNLWAEPNPASLDFGTLPYFKTRYGVVRITVPMAGPVNALFVNPPPEKVSRLSPGSGADSSRSQVRLVSLRTPEPPMAGKGFEVWGMRTLTGEIVDGHAVTDKHVATAGPIEAKAGQDLMVYVKWSWPSGSPNLGGSNTTLKVAGGNWRSEIPCVVGMLPIEKYNIELKLDPMPVKQVVQDLTQLVNLPQFDVVRGTNALVGYTVKNTGDSPVYVTFDPKSLPTGIALTPAPFDLAKGETKHLTLTFPVDQATPPYLSEARISARYGSGPNNLVGEVPIETFYFDVYDPTYAFEGGGTVNEDIWWTTWVGLRSDGTWEWHAHLHSDSTLLSDSFVCGFVFNAWVGDNVVGCREMGTLGAKYAGPARNYYVDHAAVSQLVQDHFFEFADQGVWFYINTNTDWTPIVEWVAKNLPALIMLL